MARDFDGSGNEYITFALQAGQTSMDDISIGAWLYLDSNSQYKRHFQRDDSGASDGLKWEFDDGWGWVLKTPWNTTDGAWSIAKPSTGAWVHGLVTYSWSATTNDPVMYVNGSAQGITERVTPAGTKANSGTNLTIGANPGGGAGGVGSWDGRICEFAIWNRILTVGEALILSKAYSPRFIPNGLVFYSDLIGRNNPETDTMKSASGTITGTPDAIAHPRIIYPTPVTMGRGTVAVATALPEWPRFQSRGFRSPQYG